MIGVRFTTFDLVLAICLTGKLYSSLCRMKTWSQMMMMMTMVGTATMMMMIDTHGCCKLSLECQVQPLKVLTVKN